MSPPRSRLAHAWKEARVLGPLALGGTAALFVLTPFVSVEIRVLAYFVTSLLLGALAFGHEFVHETLPLLLTQPAARTRLWAVKMAVLAACLAVVYVAAEVTIPTRGSRGAHVLLMAVPVAAACILPALTLVTRSALSGVILGAALPVFLVVAAQFSTMAWFGWSDARPESREFAGDAARWIASAACAAGLPVAWWLFRRMQANDPHGRELLPAAWTTTRSRSVRRHRVAQLVRKELRLQSGTVVVAGLSPVAVLAVWLLVGDPDPDGTMQIVTGLASVHGIAVALMAGALASAEERQFGTLEMQQLLPVAASSQWTIKCSVAFLVMLLLAVGLPWLLVSALERQLSVSVAAGLDAAVLRLFVLTTAAVYVSSLTTGGVRALAVSLPAIAAAALVGGVLIQDVAMPIGRAIASTIASVGDAGGIASIPRLRFALLRGLALGLLAAVLLLVLAFARANHATADHRALRVAGQLLWVAAAVTVAAALVAGLSGGTAQVGSRGLSASILE